MNTATGSIHELLPDIDATLQLEDLRAHERQVAELEGRAAGDIVEVSPQVAHAQRLGQREQERRKRRRQVARESRRRNR